MTLSYGVTGYGRLVGAARRTEVIGTPSRRSRTGYADLRASAANSSQMRGDDAGEPSRV